MAARAAGTTRTEIYGRPRPTQADFRQETSGAYGEAYTDYDYDTEPKPRIKRKKRHPFRRFLILLLILAALVFGLYYLLFTPVEQVSDGVRTRKEGIYNILLAATDASGDHTDTIMMATLNPAEGEVNLTSIPRDTIVDNGASVPKINGVFAMAGGGEEGAEALLDQAETILGFRADGYLLVDYQVFRDAVDAMGGVSFDVPMEMQIDDLDVGYSITLQPGQQVLDGEQALALCRYRYGYLMADIQRQYVQQSFLKAMISQCLSMENILKLPAVYSAVMDNVTTGLSEGNLRYLALRVLLGGVPEIQQNTLPGEGVDYYGASCFGLYGGSVVDMVNEVMNPYEEEVTLEDVHIVSVSGGELVESTWQGTPFDASTYVYD